MIIISVFLSNICFWFVKESSQADVSFMHKKNNMFLSTDIEIVHKQALFSESSVSQSIMFGDTNIYDAQSRDEASTKKKYSSKY